MLPQWRLVLTKALTSRRVETELASERRKEIPDGLLVGLYLVVQPTGAKSYAVRYRHGGQPRKLTIGAHPAIDLATARDLGSKALRAVAEGRDPAGEKAAGKADSAEGQERRRRDLFENVAREFITRHAQKSTRETTWRETARILGFRPDTQGNLQESGGDVLPTWRGRRVQDIAKRDVVALLDAVTDRGSPIMANRVLAAVRKFFNWCLARDIIQVSPCTLIAPPGAERSRDRILSDGELAAVWQAAKSEEWPFQQLIKLLILTGQRLNEVAGLRWEEIDLEEHLWRMPASRAKNGERHDVPLSVPASSILRSIPGSNSKTGFVFAPKGDRPVTTFSRAKSRIDQAIKASAPDLAVPHWTFHDLRRTMASGMARLGVQLPVIEKVLNHTSGTFRGVVGVYQRYSFADEKRAALEGWAAFVSDLTNEGASRR